MVVRRREMKRERERERGIRVWRVVDREREGGRKERKGSFVREGL